MNKNKFLNKQRQRRVFHNRNRLRSDSDAPRMCVTRSNKNIYCQIIDDVAGKTLVAVGSQSKEIRESLGYGGNSDAAGKIGATIAEKALAAGIKKVKFDRGANKYHGRLAALADAAREAGLEF
ncbi:MAG: 50S ribosomal protein L18 [Rhodopirellula sp.]|nr:50S ribosomal protein L18 [Rhodopirellula sp.]HCA49907.1 50S ribosomal protein L18 [Planctomycetaceae bacterium]